MRVQSTQITKNKAKKRLKNGESKIQLDELIFPSYQELRAEIDKRVGKTPPLPKDLPDGSWTEQSLKVIKERYLVKDNKGTVIETPQEMCWRVSWEIASAEAHWGKKKDEVVDIAKKFYKLLSSHEFLPNSPTLMNAGTGNMLQYSACFVLPVEDSLVGIFDALKYQALIHQTGGGTGFSFSRLRPSGSIVGSSKGTASGPVSFMRIFDAATNEIKQGGKRRGANMGILRVDHPDIMEFIHCKEEGGITNFNISVAITDAFMEAYKDDTEYDLIHPKTKEVVGSLRARDVFDEIAEGAWKTGDPGLVFIDRRNRGSSNPVPLLGPIEATNPCGEQELYPYDACNLGSIFLNYFVKEVKGKGGLPAGRQVDWKKLKEVARLSARFLDDVIEVNPFPLEQIRRTVLGIRRIGLGVGGWADMLIDLDIPYDSEEALKLGTKIMKTIQDEAIAESERLAVERGPFPMWSVSIYKNKKPRRNSTVTTIAPTGTISIIAGSSSGIEPLFAVAYQHIVKDKHLDRTLDFINPKFEERAKNIGIWTDELKNKVVEHGVVRNIDDLPENLKGLFGTAHEINYEWHIKHQAVFQKYTENAVSKTINLPNEAKVEDIKDAYLLAWETGCKGITVFRDGCKDAQVLNIGVKKDEVKKAVMDEPTLIRPFKVDGATYKLQTPVGPAFITINHGPHGQPLELFVNVGKAGSDVTAMAEALGRSISTALRFHGDLTPRERAKELAIQLAGIGGRRSVGFGPNKILSLPDAVAAALSIHFGFNINGFDRMAKHNNVMAPFTNGEVKSEGVNNDQIQLEIADIPNEQEDHEQFEFAKIAADICPSCGAGAFVYQEGCSKCYACGHSEC